MGGRNSRFEAIDTYEEEQWKEIAEVNGNKIILHQLSNKEGQLHQVSFRSKQIFQQQLQNFEKRNTASKYLVEVYCLAIKSPQIVFLCQNNILVNVVTQRLVLRFSKINPFELPEAMYILLQCLIGFQILYKMLGTFQISKNMIGVNKYGQIKVWVNENVSQNAPIQIIPSVGFIEAPGENFSRQQYRKIFTKNLKNQAKMVERIIEIVQSKYKDRAFEEQFKQILIENSETFQMEISAIHTFAKKYRFTIPDMIGKQKNQKSKHEVGPMKSFKHLKKKYDNLPDKPISIHSKRDCLSPRSHNKSYQGMMPKSQRLIHGLSAQTNLTNQKIKLNRALKSIHNIKSEQLEDNKNINNASVQIKKGGNIISGDILSLKKALSMLSKPPQTQHFYGNLTYQEQ